MGGAQVLARRHGCCHLPPGPLPTPRSGACLATAPRSESRARSPRCAHLGPRSGPGALASIVLLRGHLHAMMRGVPRAGVWPHLRRPRVQGHLQTRFLRYHLKKLERECNEHWQNGMQTVHKVDKIHTNSCEIRTKFVGISLTPLYSHTWRPISCEFGAIGQQSKQTHKNEQGTHLAIKRTGE